MSKKRAPGKPFAPGNEAANKTVKKVVATGTQVIHWRYLVISGCCGAEQTLTHDSLRRIETEGKGSLCRSCCSKEKSRIDREQRRAKAGIRALRRRVQLDCCSHEWAHQLLCHTAYKVLGPQQPMESWR